MPTCGKQNGERSDLVAWNATQAEIRTGSAATWSRGIESSLWTSFNLTKFLAFSVNRLSALSYSLHIAPDIYPLHVSDYFDEGIPFGYHITFRAYGTWLHGDSRGSVDRFHNRFGTPHLPRNEQWEEHNRKQLKHPPVKLSSRQRDLIESAIREICTTRKWTLWVTNARTNDIHSVISAFCKPERIRSAIKANATKKLREAGLWRLESSPWARKGSIKWLWTERALMNAIVYVESEQGP